MKLKWLCLTSIPSLVSQQIRQELAALSKKDHSIYDCCVVIMLSHGTEVSWVTFEVLRLLKTLILLRHPQLFLALSLFTHASLCVVHRLRTVAFLVQCMEWMALQYLFRSSQTTSMDSTVPHCRASPNSSSSRPVEEVRWILNLIEHSRYHITLMNATLVRMITLKNQWMPFH